MAQCKCGHGDHMRASDEVVDIVEVRRGLRTAAGVYDGYGVVYSPAEEETEVSVDHDIRLLDVLVYACVDGYTRVQLTISEGDTNLVTCKGSYVRDPVTDVVPVRVVTKDGAPGITLYAGHQYHIRVRIEYGWKTRYYGVGRTDTEDSASEKGVTITFRHYYSLYDTDTTILAGLRIII